LCSAVTVKRSSSAALEKVRLGETQAENELAAEMQPSCCVACKALCG
jgi:hypothetical protein